MRDDSANTLDLLTHEERIPPKVVKSSLKGSRSQLSLEEVAIAARRNAARRHSRSKADAVLKSLLHSAEKARKGRSRRKSLEILAHQGSAAMRALQQHQPQAIVIACTDCELPIPESFGAAASHVVVLRSKGNFATPAVAADVTRLVQESGIRLIMVLGHTHCAAIDIAVERWLEQRASAWPWAPKAEMSEHEISGRQAAPVKVPKASIDPDNRPPKAPVEATRTDKFSMTGNMEGHSCWKSILSCYCGADMSQDESHHSSRSQSNSNSPDTSQHGAGPRALSSSAALNCSDRTVVRTLGNTLEAAVDEVALERLKAEEAERESRAAEEPLPDPVRIPIEAPRAPRRTTSDLSTGARTRTEQAAHEKKEAAVIGRDDSTAAEVSSANAKLAAEALLRGLSKRMDNSIMHELEVVAVSADVDTAKLTLLRKGWYQQATYFFE
ncbi:g1895 [Coccomyxa viridis]|uniref:G1895 protein n=1 Tax=Coccomyxa viridis TaxID=1274662 RepID=A0ABP1FJ39_9CHLO